MSTPAIELIDLVKVFQPRTGEVRAVDGIDATISQGEVVAFLGPNGAGKTTTLDLVLGLSAPTSGTARVLGLEPRQAIHAGRVSAVLQTGGLLRDLSVRETATVIASMFDHAEPVPAVLERAGLTEIADRKVAKCSGGEQQRLRFALALLPDPDLLILDEPTAGMDVNARAEFWATMRADAAAGRTVVFATHFLQEAEEFAQRTILISDGKVIADGPTDEIRALSGASEIVVTVADPEAALRRVEPMGASLAARDGNRITLHAGDADAVALVLLAEFAGRNIEVGVPSLDVAFRNLTAKEN